MTNRPPDIVVVMTDQQRRDTIASLGNDRIRTPHMDRIVESGTSYTSAYAASPVCGAARSATMTGTAPHRNGCVANQDTPIELPSIAQMLGAEGYQTHGVGKMHFLPDPDEHWGFETRNYGDGRSIHELGRDDYVTYLAENGYGHVIDPLGMRSEMYYIPQPGQLPPEHHHSTWIADRAIEAMRTRDPERPLFTWVSFNHPHPPFELPMPWFKLFRGCDMEPPRRSDQRDNWTWWNYFQNRYKYRDTGTDASLVQMMRAVYYGMIEFVDYNLGRIFAEIDDWSNTMIVFLSDHGEMLGDYGAFGKRSMLEASVGIPLVVKYPGDVAAGTLSDAPVSQVDLFPTILAAAGIEAATHPEAHSLQDIGADADRMAYSQFGDGRYGLYMAASRRWKYVYSAADRQEWLFDRSDEHPDDVDLASSPEHAEPLRVMRDALLERFVEDGYVTAVDGHRWREYPTADRPEPNTTTGQLFQESPALAERLGALGEYWIRGEVPTWEGIPEASL